MCFHDNLALLHFHIYLAFLGICSTVLNALCSVCIKLARSCWVIGMVAASLASLAYGGSLVEVGKLDIWSPARIAQERPDVMFNLVAVDFLPPPVIQRSLTHLASMVATGERSVPNI